MNSSELLSRIDLINATIEDIHRARHAEAFEQQPFDYAPILARLIARVRGEVMEECAKIADRYDDNWQGLNTAADAIREAKEKTNGT